ncbi:MAG: hypothetical protein V4535_04875 [Bacteroidota bacterium]
MKNILRIVIISIVLVSCDDQTGISNPKFTHLDSLLNFDTITEIYTISELPPKITDDALEVDEPKPLLHVDSVNRWTNNKSIIDSIRFNFPMLSSFGTSVWETTCCGHQEIIFKTKKGQYRIYWLNFKDFGGVQFNEKYYKTNRGKLNTVINSLDRKIIRKEIYSVDSSLYDLSDHYNKINTNEYTIIGETRYVYILK